MWIVVAYYTPSPTYKACAERLRASCGQFGIPHDISEVPDLGDWYKNTQFKSTFLLRKLKEHAPKSIVYVDADATFHAYPHLFTDLEFSNTEIAVHVLDHGKYHNKTLKEMLSGTIFLRNNQNVMKICEEWAEKCKKSAKTLDQVALNEVLRGKSYSELPPEYCCIFDLMKSVENPVIKHWQASRQGKFEKRKSVVRI